MGSILTKLPAIIKKGTNKLLMLDGSLSRPTQGGTFDESTSTWSGEAPVVYTFRGIVNNATSFFRRTNTERIGNLAIIALADPSTWTPTTDPQTKDVVTIDGETGVVQKAHRDPSTSVWVLDCLS